MLHFPERKHASAGIKLVRVNFQAVLLARQMMQSHNAMDP